MTELDRLQNYASPAEYDVIMHVLKGMEHLPKAERMALIADAFANHKKQNSETKRSPWLGRIRL
jgi:hypothetical protein